MRSAGGIPHTVVPSADSPNCLSTAQADQMQIIKIPHEGKTQFGVGGAEEERLEVKCVIEQ